MLEVASGKRAQLAPADCTSTCHPFHWLLWSCRFGFTLNLLARGRQGRRVLGGWWRRPSCGTLMRHLRFVLGQVPLLPSGMVLATARRGLVALAGTNQAFPARLVRADPAAIAVSTVTSSAQQYLLRTAMALEESVRDGNGVDPIPPSGDDGVGLFAVLVLGGQEGPFGCSRRALASLVSAS